MGSPILRSGSGENIPSMNVVYLLFVCIVSVRSLRSSQTQIPSEQFPQHLAAGNDDDIEEKVDLDSNVLTDKM